MIHYRGLKTAALAAGMTAMMAIGAMAATVTATPLSIADLDGMTPQANPSATATSGAGVQENTTGSVAGEKRTPWEGSIHELTGLYTTVGAGQWAIYEFSKLQTGLSLIWGSPDNYNDLILELIIGDVVVASFNGVAAQPPVAIGASLFTVTDVQFDRLRFTSSQNAFEFANLTTTPIPLPAGGLLLIGGLGALIAVRRRKHVA